MRKFKNLTRATAVLVWTAGIAGAGIVYDNGGPVGVTGNGFSIMNPTRVADDFTVLNSTVITGVGFYFQNTAGITGWNQDVTCAFRNDASNAPGSVLQSDQGLNVTCRGAARTATLSQSALTCRTPSAPQVAHDIGWNSRERPAAPLRIGSRHRAMQRQRATATASSKRTISSPSI